MRFLLAKLRCTSTTKTRNVYGRYIVVLVYLESRSPTKTEALHRSRRVSRPWRDSTKAGFIGLTKDIREIQCADVKKKKTPYSSFYSIIDELLSYLSLSWGKYICVLMLSKARGASGLDTIHTPRPTHGGVMQANDNVWKKVPKKKTCRRCCVGQRVESLF